MATSFTYNAPKSIVEPKKRAWLKAYARCGCAFASSQSAKIGQTTYYDWRHKDLVFLEAVSDAREAYTQRLEIEADRRATEGCGKLKFGKDGAHIDPRTNEPYVEYDYSDVLLIFRLKALRPEVYRERHEVTLTRQERESRIEALLANRGGVSANLNGSTNGSTNETP